MSALFADGQIAHYRIVSKLGEGGMGAVVATDTKLLRDVAIKVLPEGYAARGAAMDALALMCFASPSSTRASSFRWTGLETKPSIPASTASCRSVSETAAVSAMIGTCVRPACRMSPKSAPRAKTNGWNS